MTPFETCPICDKQVHQYDGMLEGHIIVDHRYPELVEACRAAHDLLDNGWMGTSDDFRDVEVRDILKKALENVDHDI